MNTPCPAIKCLLMDLTSKAFINLVAIITLVAFDTAFACGEMRAHELTEGRGKRIQTPRKKRTWPQRIRKSCPV